MGPKSPQSVMNRLGVRLWILGGAILLSSLLIWASLYVAVSSPQSDATLQRNFARAVARIDASGGTPSVLHGWERRLGGRLYFVRSGHRVGAGGVCRPLPPVWNSLLPHLPTGTPQFSLRYRNHPLHYAYLPTLREGLMWIAPVPDHGGLLPWLLGALVGVAAIGLWALALHWSLRVLEGPSTDEAGLPEELRPWARTFSDLRAKVGEETRFRKALLSHLAHTLRTPLTVQRAVLKALSEEAIPPADRARYLQLALLRSEHLAGLVQDLLDWAYLEDGQGSAGTERVAVDRLLEEEMLALHPSAQEKQVTIRREPGEPQWVWGDPQRIRRICHHLLAHAIAVTPVMGTVQVGLVRRQDRVELAVSNQGPALPEAARTHFWERFLSGDREPGDGIDLGLLLVKIWTEAQGGQVGVESQVGVGSRLWVQLPAG